MKILKYKNITHLYLKLFSIVVLLPSFGSVGLYAQNPDLFDYTWYLHNLVIDNISNIPPINNEIPFVPAEFFETGTLFTGMCENGGSGELQYIGTNEFLVLEMNFLQGECFHNLPFNQDYSNLYQNFWSPLAGSGTVFYEIIEEGDVLTLTIISPNDDFAVYKNEAPLSINDFSNSKFLIYPNPVNNSSFAPTV